LNLDMTSCILHHLQSAVFARACCVAPRTLFACRTVMPTPAYLTQACQCLHWIAAWGSHSGCVLLQTVVLDYVQSEIHLKSSRDKSQLDLASMCSRPAHTAQRLEAACNCQSLFLLQRMLADMICALLSDEWFVCHVHIALACTRCWCGYCV